MRINFLVCAGFAALMILPSIGSAQITWLSTEGELQNYVSGQGLALLGDENFETSSLGHGLLGMMDDPLDTTTDNEWFNPGDIDPIIRVQSNTGGGSAAQLSPAGADALTLGSAGQAGAVSDIVLSRLAEHSTDLIVLTPGITAMGFNVINNRETSAFRVQVYSTDNQWMGTVGSNADISGTFFLGVISHSLSIGRLNFYQTGGTDNEGADNIVMYGAVPEPATAIVLAIGLAVIAARRRRR